MSFHVATNSIHIKTSRFFSNNNSIQYYVVYFVVFVQILILLSSYLFFKRKHTTVIIINWIVDKKTNITKQKPKQTKKNKSRQKQNERPPKKSLCKKHFSVILFIKLKHHISQDTSIRAREYKLYTLIIVGKVVHHSLDI